MPRLRRKLVRTPPLCGRPVWVDGPEFAIEQHMRAVRCPDPGDEAGWRCCVGESRTDIAVEALASDGQREFAEDRFEPVTGHGVESEFVVAAAKVLHKRVPAADRLRAA